MRLLLHMYQGSNRKFAPNSFCVNDGNMGKSSVPYRIDPGLDWLPIELAKQDAE
jgi:hypothetical protein